MPGKVRFENPFAQGRERKEQQKPAQATVKDPNPPPAKLFASHSALQNLASQERQRRKSRQHIGAKFIPGEREKNQNRSHPNY